MQQCRTEPLQVSPCCSPIPMDAPFFQVSKHLRGEVGLLFTNRTRDEVDE